MALTVRLAGVLVLVLLLAVAAGQLLGDTRCFNGGRYNPVALSCDCLDDYDGLSCETPICDTSDDDDCRCGRWNATKAIMCSNAAIKILCPRMCGNCINSCNNGTCKHGGFLNMISCECDCLPGFYGSKCEIVNCTGCADPSQCTTDFTKADCDHDRNLHGLCPILCGTCNATHTANCPTTDLFSISDEGFCDNLGCYDNSSALAAHCQCPAGYFGEKCESLNCDKVYYDDPLCETINSTLCMIPYVSSMCPFMCGRCPMSKVSCLLPIRKLCGGTTSNCSALDLSSVQDQCATCKNLGKFNNSTRTCECLPSFTGPDCGTRMCTLSDNQRCAKLSTMTGACSNVKVLALCPTACGVPCRSS